MRKIIGWKFRTHNGMWYDDRGTWVLPPVFAHTFKAGFIKAKMKDNKTNWGHKTVGKWIPVLGETNVK